VRQRPSTFVSQIVLFFEVRPSRDETDIKRRLSAEAQGGPNRGEREIRRPDRQGGERHVAKG